jgi:hypothetical protein
MIVRGKTTSENIIEGRFTTAELEALIRASLAIPKGATFFFYNDGDISTIDDHDNPVRFTITWRDAPDFNQESAIQVVVGAPRETKPLPYGTGAEPVHPNR